MKGAERWGSYGLLLLRVGAGGLMAGAHGLDKLLTFTEKAASFGDPLGVGSTASLALAVFAEFFCAIAVALGLFTRFAAVPLVITMGVAAFIVHADDPFSKKELALLYGIPFLALVLTGPGDYSLDRLLRRRSKRRSR